MKNDIDLLAGRPIPKETDLLIKQFVNFECEVSGRAGDVIVMNRLHDGLFINIDMSNRSVTARLKTNNGPALASFAYDGCCIALYPGILIERYVNKMFKELYGLA